MAQSSEGVDPVIETVMSEKGVRVDQIPNETAFNKRDLPHIRKNSRRYFHTKAFGSYRCVCGRGWKSAHSWCMTDLKKQRFFEKFGQDCQICECQVEPTFDLEAKRRMAEYAVDTYLRRSGKVKYPKYTESDAFDFGDWFDLLPDSTGPHDQARCETCKLLGTSCWT